MANLRLLPVGILVVLAIVLVIIAYSESDKPREQASSFGTPIFVEPSATAEPGSSPEPPSPTPVPQPTGVAQGDRLLIQRLGVEDY